MKPSSSLYFLPIVCCLAAGCLAAVVVGCAGSATTASSPQTGSGTAPVAFFTGRPTFDFIVDPSLEAAGAVSNRPYWAKRIRDAITGALKQKGYRRVQSGKPGMLVAYHVITQQGDAVSVNSNYTGYHLTDMQQSQASLNALIPPSGSGTLVVDFVDPAKKEIVWRTSKQTTLDHLSTADERDKALGGIVQDALSTVPVHA